MTKQEINVQESFLFQCLKNKALLKLELLTGSSITGPLKRFDRFALLLEQDGAEILVYKHAIATLEVRQAAAADE
jgi:host factor-I protein